MLQRSGASAGKAPRIAEVVQTDQTGQTVQTAYDETFPTPENCHRCIVGGKHGGRVTHVPLIVDEHVNTVEPCIQGWENQTAGARACTASFGSALEVSPAQMAMQTNHYET